MTTQKSVALLFVLCIAGCVPSLHQLYTEKTLVYDPQIVGKYGEPEEYWMFVGDPNDKSYELTIVEGKGKQSKLKAHFVKFGGQRFFDFYPSDLDELEGGDWLKFHILPVHLFFKVEQTEPNLMIAMMNPDTVGELLEKKPGLVKHEVVEDGRVILTDTPENLQKFLLESMKVEDLFGDVEELERVKEK